MNKKTVIKARSRLSPEQRIAEIMSTTRKMLSEIGYENIVTAEIADRCGISEATIYKYFESKRDLLIRVAEEWFNELLSEDTSVSPSQVVREQLYHHIWQSLSIIRREPTLTRFVLMELRSDPDYRNMRIYQLNRQFTSKISTTLQAAMDSGAFRKDVPIKLLRDMIYGCIEHQTWAYLRDEGDFSAEETSEYITDIIYRGLQIQ
jgi:TetR/AcrR family fatty acid metabolism transcriptional regulator